ncbi:hypothetical protein PCASD_23792 [Puccinia coronata f. sp. avenae]|uniref:Uncharacterized protein n=1 Tax=Puccinia coronata f. sp. avenae TaxID=200324 RepID=A0A2N5SZ55_9BASI|nr:hypothetical protein PCASD_23792 [Puccinia coronata f. sp. avenae]
MSTKTNQFDLTTASIDNGAKDGTTPSNTGAITVTPKVWAKMQSLLALLPTKPITSSPNAANQPIGLPDNVVPQPLLPSIASDSTGSTEEENRSMAKENNLINNIPCNKSASDHHNSPTTNQIPMANQLAQPSNQIVNTEDPAPPAIISNIDKYDFSTGEPLDPPPPSRFASMDDLVCFCQSWAKNHGYAIFKANSHAGKNVYTKCD